MSKSSGVERDSLASSSGSDGGYDHAPRREVGKVPADVVEHRFVVLGDVVDYALARATLGPPRSSFEISSPVDSFTTVDPR